MQEDVTNVKKIEVFQKIVHVMMDIQKIHLFNVFKI